MDVYKIETFRISLSKEDYNDLMWLLAEVKSGESLALLTRRRNIAKRLWDDIKENF